MLFDAARSKGIVHRTVPLTFVAQALRGELVSRIHYVTGQGEELDARTDIFSLGAVLYEMTTGKVAFPGKTSAATFKAAKNTTPSIP